jgi:hypothetical protein
VTLTEIQKYLDQLDDLRLECDGMTRVITYKLRELDVEHEVRVGCIAMGDKEFIPHYWIELRLGAVPYIIDYRARMWLGPDAPHGVFEKASRPDVTYDGEAVPMIVDKRTYDILIVSGAWGREIP